MKVHPRLSQHLEIRPLRYYHVLSYDHIIIINYIKLQAKEVHEAPGFLCRLLLLLRPQGPQKKCNWATSPWFSIKFWLLNHPISRNRSQNLTKYRDLLSYIQTNVKVKLFRNHDFNLPASRNQCDQRVCTSKYFSPCGRACWKAVVQAVSSCGISGMMSCL